MEGIKSKIITINFIRGFLVRHLTYAQLLFISHFDNHFDDELVKIIMLIVCSFENDLQFCTMSMGQSLYDF